jgi:hypothetical protein
MDRQYSSVIFLGDWFRCRLGQLGRIQLAQAANVAWMSRLLAPAVGIRPDDLRVIMPSTDRVKFARQIGNTALVDRYFSDPLGTWADLFDSVTSQDCFSDLFEQLSSNDLVIGFEIPPVMRRILTDRGLAYVSLHNHPLRFLKDLAFGAYTNDLAIRGSLEAIACNDREIEIQVARYSARLLRLNPVQSHIPDGCPVLFGQTDHDASLISDGKFARWTDFAEEIADELSGDATVAFVRHPQGDWPTETIEFLRTQLGKSVIGISGNSYPLIMSGRSIGTVLTLSSSIGVEAAAFGYRTRFLLADPRDKFAVVNNDNPSQIMLDHRIFEPAFWQEVLSGSGQGIEARPEAFYLGGNFVRGTLEGWSFNQLDETKPFVSMEKIVIPAADASQDQLDQLVRTLSGSDDPIRDAAAAYARAADIKIQVLAPPLTSGGIWSWAAKTPDLGFAILEGFYPHESAGCWTAGHVGTIDIPVAGERATTLRLQGEIAFSLFRGILPHSPAVQLYVDGQPRSTWLHRHDEDPYHRLPFVADVRAGGLCRLRIEVSHAGSPLELGLGEDTRTIALMLHEVFVSARPSKEVGDLPPQQIWGIGDDPIDIPKAEKH